LRADLRRRIPAQVNKAAAPLRAVHTAGSLHNITPDSVNTPGPVEEANS
jgi:anthranilate synthase component 1